METKLKFITDECAKVQPDIEIWACDECDCVYEMPQSELPEICGHCGWKNSITRNSRNIHLADILLAINEKLDYSEFTFQTIELLTHKVKSWNLLKDSLTDQSPETIDLIFNLLS